MVKPKKTEEKAQENLTEEAKAETVTEQVPETPAVNLCPDCLAKGIKVTMTRGSMAGIINCPKCQAWRNDPGYKETVQEEETRLKARLAEIERMKKS